MYESDEEKITGISLIKYAIISVVFSFVIFVSGRMMDIIDDALTSPDDPVYYCGGDSLFSYSFSQSGAWLFGVLLISMYLRLFIEINEIFKKLELRLFIVDFVVYPLMLLIIPVSGFFYMLLVG